MEYSENQQKFVDDAEEQGLEVRRYSGRGMFGRECPAITVDYIGEFATKARTRSDSMGLGIVIYAQD